MWFSAFHRYPFLIPLITLGSGIYVGDMLYTLRQPSWVVFCFIGLAAGGIIGSLVNFKFRHYTARHIFGLSETFFFFGLGVMLMFVHLYRTAIPSMDTPGYFRVLLLEQPEEKEKTMGCLAAVRSESLRGEVMLYVEKDSLSKSLCAGDELWMYALLQQPQKQGNPEEFDYGRFLHRRGIGATAYVRSEYWQLCSDSVNSMCRNPKYSWKLKAADYRSRVLQLYRKLGFQGDDLAVLSALTIGDKEYLTDTIRTTYSRTGASHVLALSGLHIGFLYLLLGFVFGLLPKWKGSQWIRFVGVAIILWAFAFFTGMSPSVVRAVSMFTLFAFAKALGRTHFSFNVMLSAGFLMLLVVPEWLFEIGFQLSFSAVAAILLLQPRIYRLLFERDYLHIAHSGTRPCFLSFKRKFCRYVGGLLSVSIAAQLGTAPWVLYYFYDFPTHFLLTNLCVIPLVSLIVYFAVGMLILNFLPILQTVMASIVSFLLQLLNDFVCWIECLPGATIEDCNIRLCAVWLFIGLLILVAVYRRYTYRRVLVILSGCLFLCTIHLALQKYHHPKACISFFSVPSCPAVHLVNDRGDSWLVCPDSLPKTDKWDRTMHRYLLRNGIQHPEILSKNRVRTKILDYDPPYLYFGGARLCILGDNHYLNRRAIRPLRVDYIYLCGTYSGSISELKNFVVAPTILLDVSLPKYRLQALKTQCREQGLHYFDLSSEGSFTFWL